MLEAAGDRRGVALTIRKGLPLSSGLGGSAASAAAAVVAVNALIGGQRVDRHTGPVRAHRRRPGRGRRPSRQHRAGDLRRLRARAPSQSARHRPLAGARRTDGRRRPSGSRNRNRARAGAARRPTVPLADAVRQWANLGALVHGLHVSDFELISRVARGLHRRAAPRTARARPGGHQARGRRRRRARLQPVGVGPVDLRALPRPRHRRPRGRRHDGRGPAGNRRSSQTYVSSISTRGALRRDRMRFVSTRGQASAASLGTALFDGLAPDGGLYVPDTIEAWSDDEIAGLPSRSLPELGVRVLKPFAAGAIDAATLSAVVHESLDFPIPLIEIEPGIFALELFHGPTLAFKDVGARVMARLMAALGADVTVLTATSGDTGSAVANAFHGIASARVVILYPDGPREPDPGSAVDDVQQRQRVERSRRMPWQAASTTVSGSSRKRSPIQVAAPPDSADVGQLDQRRPSAAADDLLLPGSRRVAADRLGVAVPVVCTPSGNFGNLTAGLLARRAGAPIERFVAATNVNDVVPSISRHRPVHGPPVGSDHRQRDGRRQSQQLRAPALAVRRQPRGRAPRHRRLPLRGRRGPRDRCGRCSSGAAISSIPTRRLDTSGSRGRADRARRAGRPGIFLATAHPAKFPEIVEPVIGRSIEKPAGAHAGVGAAAKTSSPRRDARGRQGRRWSLNVRFITTATTC